MRPATTFDALGAVRSELAATYGVVLDAQWWANAVEEGDRVPRGWERIKAEGLPEKCPAIAEIALAGHSDIERAGVAAIRQEIRRKLEGGRSWPECG